MMADKYILRTGSGNLYELFTVQIEGRRAYAFKSDKGVIQVVWFFGRMREGKWGGPDPQGMNIFEMTRRIPMAFMRDYLSLELQMNNGTCKGFILGFTDVDTATRSIKESKQDTPLKPASPIPEIPESELGNSTEIAEIYMKIH